MMKRYIAFFVCLLLIASMSAPLAAMSQTEPSGDGQAAVARVEETEWLYRNNNGVLEKRLWSITYGYWKTEWMPC